MSVANIDSAAADNESQILFLLANVAYFVVLDKVNSSFARDANYRLIMTCRSLWV